MKLVKPAQMSNTLRMYTILDRIAGKHDGPFVVPTDVEACRSFAAYVKQSPFPAKDFALCYVADFDNSTGCVKPVNIVEIDTAVFVKDLTPPTGKPIKQRRKR